MLPTDFDGFSKRKEHGSSSKLLGKKRNSSQGSQVGFGQAISRNYEDASDAINRPRTISCIICSSVLLLLEDLDPATENSVSTRPQSNWLHQRPDVPDRRHPPTIVFEKLKSNLSQNQAYNIQNAIKTLTTVCKEEVKNLASSYHCADHELPNWGRVPSQVINDICVVASAKMIYKCASLDVIWQCEDLWPAKMLMQTKWTQKVSHSKSEHEKVLDVVKNIMIQDPPLSQQVGS